MAVVWPRHTAPRSGHRADRPMLTPWWDGTAARVRAAGGRADEWRFPVELPPLLDKFDRAAGLRHDELKARTLTMNI